MEKKISLIVLLTLLGAELASASGLLVPRDGSPPIHLRSHRVVVHVEDGLARTTVRQTFFNPHPRVLEAIYHFPLPEEAALVDLAMEVGGQRLEGFLAERKTARRSYDTLKRQQIDPALIEQVGRSTFRLSVFPVMPKEPTVIEMTWIQSVPLRDGEYRYVYPLALDEASTKVKQDLTFSLTVRSSVPIKSIESPNEEMATAKVSMREANASLESMEAALSDDLVVVTKVRTPEPSLDVHVHRPAKGDTYFAAVVTPPALEDDQIIPRDVTLVLDISGSMKGTKFTQAREAGKWLVDRLRPQDRLNILLFNNDVRSFHAKPIAATRQNREAMHRFLDEASAGGGTALGDAIRRASETPKEEGRSTMAVILTDGLPTVGETRPESIIAFSKAGRERGLQTYTFGVGNDVDGTLLDGVAAAGGGQSQLFRLGGEIESRLQTFLTRTGSPAIVDLKVTMNDRRVDDLLPRPLGDIYLGEQMVLTGRVPGQGDSRLVVEGVLDGKRIRLERVVNLSDYGSYGDGAQPVIARDLYAHAKLGFLQRALRLRNGLADDAYFAALNRGAYSTEDELVSALIDLSLDTGVQCAYTSFLALIPEDRRRLDPRDANALDAAIARAQKARQKLAGISTDGNWETKVARGGPGAGGPVTGAGSPIPPGNPGGPGTPGPGAPRRPVDSKSGALAVGRGTGGGPVVPGGGGGAARPKTGGFTKRSSGAGFEQWEFWWEHNKAACLQRHQQRVEAPVTPELFRRKILPVLLHTLESESDADILDSTVLALARSLTGAEADVALDSLLAQLKHTQESVKQSSTLALGVLGSPKARAVLRDLVVDSQDGRNHLGQSDEVPSIVRAFAAIALGMIGDERDIALLMQTFDEVHNFEHDLQSCALLALGMFDQRQTEIANYLLEVMNRRDVHRICRCLAPIAIARLDRGIARSVALGDLLGKIRSDKTDNDMMRSCVLAITELADMSDPGVLDAFIALIDNNADQQTRHFAYIALGRIAGRDHASGTQAANKSAHEELMGVLLRDVTNPKKGTHRPWAGLALGLCMREAGPLASASVQKALEAVEEVFLETNNPSYKGAMAVSLGLMGATSAAPRIAEALSTCQESGLRGYLALSLGMLNYTPIVEQLESMAVQKGLDFKSRLNIVRSLGLMARPESTEVMVDYLANTTILSETASIAMSIGLAGDEGAVEPLLAILMDTKQKDLVRAFASVALGLLAEKTELPWNAPIGVGLNYRAKSEAIAEILDIL